MEHEERPGLRATLLEGALYPILGLCKVARDGVPQDAGHAFLLEGVYRLFIQQVRTERAAAAERAEQAIGMRELAELVLSVEDLASRFASFMNRSQGHAVRDGVVADPVALDMGPLGELAPRGVGELRAGHEERGADVFFLQDFQDMLGDTGLGPVVEGEGDLRPWHAS